MVENEEQPTQEAAPEQPVITSAEAVKPAKVAVEPAQQKLAPAKKSGGGSWLLMILLFIVLGIAAAGYYLFTQLKTKQEGLGGEVKSELTKQISDYQGQLSAIQSQISALQSDISGKDNQFNKTLSNFSDLQSQKMEATRKELNDKVTQLQRQLGKTRGDWLIADAEYLLSVANERLHLVGDLNTTRSALEAADQRLRESGDSGVIPIREQIAKELSSLQGIKIADIVGIYAAIQALESEVGKLNLLLPYSGKPNKEKPSSTESSKIGEDHNDLLNSAIEELEGIVTIKHSEKPITEILTAEQADFIREQLKLKLEMVKVALVQQNDAMFQAGLADIKLWMEQHFNKNEDADRIIAELTYLQENKLRKQFPDISTSLKMLRDISKLRVETDKAIDADAPKDSSEKEKNDEGKDKATANSEVKAPDKPEETSKTESEVPDASAMPKP